MVNNSIFNKDDDEYENDDNTNDKEQVSSCYIGTDMAAWNTSIKAIIKANIDLYPKIFCGSSDKWVKVIENFPNIEHFGIYEKLLEKSISAMDFIKHQVSNNNIATVNGTTEEQKALALYFETEQLFNIIRKRIHVNELYENVIKATKAVTNSESEINLLTTEILFADQTHQREIGQTLLTRHKNFMKTKATFIEVFNTFESESKGLAFLEDHDFTEKWNKNAFINARILKKNLFEFEQFVDRMSQKWDSCLEFLRSIKFNAPSLTEEFELNLKTEQKQKTTTVKNRLKQLENIVKDVNITSSGCLILEMTLEQTSDLRRSILDAYCIDELNSEESKIINDTKAFELKVATQIEKLKDEKNRQQMREEINIASNIRAIENIRLVNLYGHENFLEWRKSQLTLNSHVDPFKKAQALRNTLKVSTDRIRTNNIYDFEVLLKILDKKYLQDDQIIPSLVSRLLCLKPCGNEEQIRYNIAVINNTCLQLNDLGDKAIEKIDFSLIQNLLLKFPKEMQEEFEYETRRHKIHCKVSDRKELDDNEKRKLFLNYLSTKDEIMNSMKNRYYAINGVKKTNKPETSFLTDAIVYEYEVEEEEVDPKEMDHKDNLNDETEIYTNVDST